MTIITATQAAEIAGVSSDTIVRWCYRGDCKFSRQLTGRIWAIDEDSFREFLPNRPTGGRAISLDRASVRPEQVKTNRQKMDRLIANAAAGKVKALEVPANMDGKELKRWLKERGRNSKQQAAV